MSESHKGEKNHFYGKHHTEEAKRNMSKIKKTYTGSKHPRAKKVICADTGETFETIKQAAEKYNISHGHISQACKKQYGRKTAGGFTWNYA